MIAVAGGIGLIFIFLMIVCLIFSAIKRHRTGQYALLQPDTTFRDNFPEALNRAASATAEEPTPDDPETITDAAVHNPPAPNNDQRGTEHVRALPPPGSKTELRNLRTRKPAKQQP